VAREWRLISTTASAAARKPKGTCGHPAAGTVPECQWLALDDDRSRDITGWDFWSWVLLSDVGEQGRWAAFLG